MAKSLASVPATTGLPQVLIEKAKGEILGVVIVESGWGSILPTVIIANMMHAGPAERSGRLNIGDQIMSINGTSLVGLPLSTCQSIIKVSPQMPDVALASQLTSRSTQDPKPCSCPSNDIRHKSLTF